MNIKNIPLHKLTPKDVSGTPEDFEKRFERRREAPSKAELKKPLLDEVAHENMNAALEKFGLADH